MPLFDVLEHVVRTKAESVFVDAELFQIRQRRRGWTLGLRRLLRLRDCADVCWSAALNAFWYSTDGASSEALLLAKPASTFPPRQTRRLTVDGSRRAWPS